MSIMEVIEAGGVVLLDEVDPPGLKATIQYTGIARCQQVLRTGQCAMHNGHRGRHTTVAYFCDCCNNMRRGSAQSNTVRYGFEGEESLTQCWFCRNVDLQWQRDQLQDEIDYIDAHMGL